MTTFFLIKKIVNRFKRFGLLQKLKWKVIFIADGNHTITIPPVSYKDFFLKEEYLNRCYELTQRPSKEVLLRQIIFNLFRLEFLDRNSSIIDIGSWIADNSLVWALNLKEEGTVYAIDPSSKNLEFSKKIAQANGIHNIKFIQAVCSDTENIPLEFDGDISHAKFRTTNPDKTDVNIFSKTLDGIIKKELNEKQVLTIGLLHVDVEGFELKVLKGAVNLIERDRPVITFEQHISRENIFEVIDFLRGYEYDVYMLNEVIPGNDLDCRNFIAFYRNRSIPEGVEDILELGKDFLIFNATVERSLIKVL